MDIFKEAVIDLLNKESLNKVAKKYGLKKGYFVEMIPIGQADHLIAFFEDKSEAKRFVNNLKRMTYEEIEDYLNVLTRFGELKILEKSDGTRVYVYNPDILIVRLNEDDVRVAFRADEFELYRAKSKLEEVV